VPLAIVASDGDRHVPRAANADRLAAAVPGARLIDASPFGHDIPHVNPEPVLEAIRWVVQQANRVSIDRP
jgi:pimeloyl-ACP methyl ester carboxylesterase